MFHEVLPRQTLEVHAGGLVLNRVEARVLIGRPLRLRETEVLERGLVRRFVVKVVWVEMWNGKLMDSFLNSDRLVPDFRHLIRCEGLLVLRNTAVGHRVDWVLRVLLVEHIGLTILPVGIVHFVAAV